MLTVNKKSLKPVARPAQIWHSLVSSVSFIQLEQFKIGSRFVPICVKSVKVFKNDHSLCPLNSENQVIKNQ